MVVFTFRIIALVKIDRRPVSDVESSFTCPTQLFKYYDFSLRPVVVATTVAWCQRNSLVMCMV